MGYLRMVLFLGLVAHKTLWEVLKRRDNLQKPSRPRSTSLIGLLIKIAKVTYLVFLIVQTLFLDVFPISRSLLTLRIVGTVIFFAGLGIAIKGRLQLGDNWVDLEDYQLLPQQSLVVDGIFRYIRHPIYTGDILLLVGLELALNSWLVLTVIFPIVVVLRQVMAEEAILSKAFPEYRDYCQRTKRFIPFIL